MFGRVFTSKSFRTTLPHTYAARYRRKLQKHPHLLFGLPFVATIVLGSFLLTPATALRYERHDRKVRQLTKQEELGIGHDRRKVDMKEEYYVRRGAISTPASCFADSVTETDRPQKLQAKDLDSWEQRRVKRLPGEIDGILE